MHVTLESARRAERHPSLSPDTLREQGLQAGAIAAFEPGLHWSERLSWRLVADAYRERADRLELEYAALESERAVLLARLGARR